MQIAADLPSDLVAFQGATDTRQESRTFYAMWLFQRERVTLSKAAEVAGVSLYEFISLCKSNQIPVIDMSRDELTAEFEGIESAYRTSSSMGDIVFNGGQAHEESLLGALHQVSR